MATDISKNPGFRIHIGKGRRDQVVAAWLKDASSNPEINVSEMVKNYLYEIATGQPYTDPSTEAIISYMESEFEEMKRLIRTMPRGGSYAQEAIDTEADPLEIESRLMQMDD